MDLEKIKQIREQDSARQQAQEDTDRIVEAMRGSQDSVAEALNTLVVATIFSKDPNVVKTAKSFASLLSEIAKASDSFKGSKLNLLPIANEKLANSIDKLANKVVEKSDSEKDYTEEFRAIRSQLEKLPNVRPIVNVPSSDLNIQPIVTAVKELSKSLGKQKTPSVSVDVDSIIEELKKVQRTIGSLKFPVPNYILPFKDTEGKAVQVNLDSSGNVPVSLASGTNSIGQVSVVPQTSNGLSVFNATSSDGATALTNSAQAIKASAGQIYGWFIFNPNSSAQFVQIYNVAAASVTVGTTPPLFMLTIPAVSAANVEFTNGIAFSTAMSCAATATAGGNGAPSSAIDAVFFFK